VKLPKITVTNSIVLVALLVIVNSLWLPTKAWLSQQLILFSWQQAVNEQHSPAPWPWADTYPIAKMSLPRLNHQLVVLMGADPSTLAFSAGMYHQFSTLNRLSPVVIAGHRDSHFAFLEDIQMKDIIMLSDNKGKNHLYQVEEISIVDSSQEDLIVKDEPELTLVTCYPFKALEAGSSLRYVVKAKLLKS
jgi:sortase A